jgi:uncharacterized protein YdhG (YjbR/CyaY superfamily)
MGTVKGADQKSVSAKGRISGKLEGFSEEELAAIREHRKEIKLRAGAGAKADNANGESEVLAKIASMSPRDREIAEKIHAIVKEHAPMLTARTWYGMPAYARDGQVICFFQSSDKFKTRYSTLGFSDKAKLDDGAMWPTAFAVSSLTAAEEKKIIDLVRRAIF